MLPQKNGREVYRELKMVRPDLKTLFMSGYAADIVSERGAPEQDVLFLPKPIAPQVLLKKVCAVIGK